MKNKPLDNFVSSKDESSRKKVQLSKETARMPGLFDQFKTIEKNPNTLKNTQKPPKTFNARSSQLNQPRFVNDLHQIAALGLLKRLDNLKRNSKKFNELLTSEDGNKHIPLEIACSHGQYEIVERLLSAHKELNIPYTIVNIQKSSPLISAINGYLRALLAFYDLNIPLDSDTAKAHERYEKTIVLLLKEQPEHINTLNANARNALFYIVKEISLLLSANKNINDENRALKLQKLKDIAQILLATDIKLDAKECNVLDYALDRKVNELLDELIMEEPTRCEAHLVNSFFKTGKLMPIPQKMQPKILSVETELSSVSQIS